MSLILQKLEKKLAKYYCYQSKDNALAVAEDKTTLPFLIFTVDEARPLNLISSVAINYSDAVTIAAIITTASSEAILKSGEPFYISNTDGNTYVGDAAYDRFTLENMDMNDLVPESKELH